MVTDNFTGIAKFVAKLAYIYVVCNTYIPRVYIRMPFADSTVLIRLPFLSSTVQLDLTLAPARGRQKHELKFMKYNSVIRNHESEFSN